MIRVILLLVMVFCIGKLKAQNNKIIFSNTIVKLDGVLNESIWEKLTPEENFIDYMPENGAIASKQTEVRMFHNGKNLYISAVYKDTTSKVQL